MNPRRLHSETIFSISGFSFGSAISRAVFLNDGLMSREAHTGRRTEGGAHGEVRGVMGVYSITLKFGRFRLGLRLPRSSRSDEMPWVSTHGGDANPRAASRSDG